jgi:polysaccharide biosynthesis/export protein VpsN
MKQLRNLGKVWAAAAAILSVAILIAGCKTPEFIEDVPGIEPPPIRGDSVVLHTGDSVQVSFVAPGSEKVFVPYDARIQADGNITPPDIGSIKAAGKTEGELQADLQKEYNKLYRNVTVTVRAGDRSYYVDGEVKQSGPKLYLGNTDVVGAIAAAGGFTDFANQKKIQLIRPNGKKHTINYRKALEDSTYNLSVYPGDKIVVPRSIW